MPWHSLRVLLTLYGKMAQEWNNINKMKQIIKVALIFGKSNKLIYFFISENEEIELNTNINVKIRITRL